MKQTLSIRKTYLIKSIKHTLKRWNLQKRTGKQNSGFPWNHNYSKLRIHNWTIYMLSKFSLFLTLTQHDPLPTLGSRLNLQLENWNSNSQMPLTKCRLHILTLEFLMTKIPRHCSWSPFCPSSGILLVSGLTLHGTQIPNFELKYSPFSSQGFMLTSSFPIKQHWLNPTITTQATVCTMNFWMTIDWTHRYPGRNKKLNTINKKGMV